MIHDICAEHIIKCLQNAGYEAYIVGGTLRDLILDRKPNNWEICTNANMIDAYELFGELGITVIRGLSDASLSVIMSDDEFNGGVNTEAKVYTVNKYRIQYKNEDRDITLKEDLLSRDFTVNALAYNKEEGIIDFCDGLRDIKDRKIKCVGDTYEELRTNPIRILRAIRFKYQLNFNFDASTDRIIDSLTADGAIDRIDNASKQQELIKIMIQDNIQDLLIRYKNVMMSIIPELMDCDEFTYIQDGKVMNTYSHMAKTAGIYNLKGTVDYRDRLAAFLHDIAKPATYRNDFTSHEQISSLLVGNIMHRLNFSDYDTKYVTDLVKYHGIEIVSKYEIKQLVNSIGIDETYKLLELKHADALANSNANIDKQIKMLTDAHKWLDSLSGKAIGFSVSDLKVSGKDLMSMGMEPGKNFGLILNKLADLVLLGKLNNNKQELIEYIQSNYIK